MKDFHCKDTGMNCEWVGKGNTKEEVFKQVTDHAQKAHQMPMTPELTQRVDFLIHDEESIDHKISMARSK